MSAQNQASLDHGPGVIADFSFLVSPSATTGDLVISLNTDPDNLDLYATNGFMYDPIQTENSTVHVNVVPEPGSMALLGCAVLTMSGILFRRRRLSQQ